MLLQEEKIIEILDYWPELIGKAVWFRTGFTDSSESQKYLIKFEVKISCYAVWDDSIGRNITFQNMRLRDQEVRIRKNQMSESKIDMRNIPS